MREVLTWGAAHPWGALIVALLSMTFWRAVYMIDTLSPGTPKVICLPWVLLAGASAALFFANWPECSDWHDPAVAAFLVAMLWIMLVDRRQFA